MKILLIILGVFVVLYMYLIAPRLTKKNQLEVFKGRYYAHRGLHDNKSDAPENSLLAFQRAVDSGYGIELDVQLTKDEVMVVFHDDFLERVCGVEGKVNDYTYSELLEMNLLKTEQKIPTFQMVLDLVDGKVPLIVEIKMSDANKRVCEVLDHLLQEYRGDYCVESFNPLAVRWYKKHNANVIRGQLSSALNQESGKKSIVYFLVEHLLTNELTRPDFIAYNHLFKKRLGRLVCKNVFRCVGVTWTIKSQEELDRAKKDFDIFIFEGFIPVE